MATRTKEKNVRLPALLAVLIAAVLTGCGHRASGPGGIGVVLRIGYQKGGALNLMRLQGTLEKQLNPRGVTVQWLNFPAGPQLMEGLGAGSIDIGETGDTPPIFAQAAGVPLVYAANVPPTGNGKGQAIIVPKDSPIHTLADLRGKKVAFQQGSSAHYFVIQALKQAGVEYKEIQSVYLSPPDAQAAFSSGSVDAWAIWDPFLSIAEQHTGARVLRDATGLPTSGGFYLASRRFAVSHPDLVRAVLDEAKTTGDWAHGHPQEAAAMLAPNVGLDITTLEQIIRGGYTTNYRPINGGVIALQQQEADAFYSIGALPRHIEIRDDTLTPQQYALLTPVRLSRVPGTH